MDTHVPSIDWSRASDYGRRSLPKPSGAELESTIEASNALVAKHGSIAEAFSKRFFDPSKDH